RPINKTSRGFGFKRIRFLSSEDQALVPATYWDFFESVGRTKPSHVWPNVHQRSPLHPWPGMTNPYDAYR
ncbi:MAG: hypothetical protein SGPRY_014939, partial [Prymnesium sp.]